MVAVEGRSNPEIAAVLGIGPATVKTHIQRALDKTGQHNRVGLANLAHRIRVPGWL